MLARTIGGLAKVVKTPTRSCQSKPLLRSNEKSAGRGMSTPIPPLGFILPDSTMSRCNRYCDGRYEFRWYERAGAKHFQSSLDVLTPCSFAIGTNSGNEASPLDDIWVQRVFWAMRRFGARGRMAKELSGGAGAQVS